MRNRKLLVPGITVLVLALSLVAAACGGSSSYSSTQPPTSAPRATADAGAPPTTSATVSAATNAKLNKTILVDSAGMTLYTYGNDTSEMSACNGGCASEWPPLAAGAESPTGGPGVTGTLGTITRSDGTKQVTYNGMPLYGWEQDQQPGDVTGDGLEGFHVAVP
jgi:predicted lipoprotein with Yx(FWY)xxD motif